MYHNFRVQPQSTNRSVNNALLFWLVFINIACIAAPPQAEMTQKPLTGKAISRSKSKPKDLVHQPKSEKDCPSCQVALAQAAIRAVAEGVERISLFNAQRKRQVRFADALGVEAIAHDRQLAVAIQAKPELVAVIESNHQGSLIGIAAIAGTERERGFDVEVVGAHVAAAHPSTGSGQGCGARSRLPQWS